MFDGNKRKVWTKPASFSIRKAEEREPRPVPSPEQPSRLPAWIAELGKPRAEVRKKGIRRDLDKDLRE